jgi:adenylylsulfate kinase-like enzyme
MTGVGSPYEAPDAPDLEVAPGTPLEDAVERVLATLAR